MTLEETIIWLKDDIKEINRDLANEEFSSTYAEEGIKVYEMAISAIKEVQQYREIGTVEQCKEMNSIISRVERNELAKIIDEWIQYNKIGTVEECREAMEKQNAKKPDYEGDGYADGHMVYDTWICPNCGEKYEVDYDDYKHCPNCGQAILKENEDD